MIAYLKRLFGRGRRWEPDTPREAYSLTQRIEWIVASSSPARAIRRLTGYLGQHYWHAYLRYTLGTLHLHHGDQIEAGKLLYFKAKKTPMEQRAVATFARRYGGDPVHLLRQLLGQHPRSPRLLRTEVKQEVWQLLEAARQQTGRVPRFMQGWEQLLAREFAAEET